MKWPWSIKAAPPDTTKVEEAQEVLSDAKRQLDKVLRQRALVQREAAATRAVRKRNGLGKLVHDALAAPAAPTPKERRP